MKPRCPPTSGPFFLLFALLALAAIFPQSLYAQDECNGGIAASVSPDSATDTVSANTTGNSVVFVVHNLGPCTDYSYLTPSGSGTVSNVTVDSASVYLHESDSRQVTVHFDIGDPPGGGVSLSASGYYQDEGSYNVTAGVFDVSVAPNHGALSVIGGVAQVDTFLVTNTGTWSDTYTLICSSTGSDYCGTVSPGTVTLAPTASQTVVVNFTPGGDRTSTLRLTAASWGNPSVSDSGDTVLSRMLSLVDYNQGYYNPAACVANCFDAVVSYTTEPHYSKNIVHPPPSLQLVYRSSLAHPMPVVQFNAWDTTGAHPTKMSVLLKNENGAFVHFTNDTTEIFFACTQTSPYSCESSSNRLAVQFDGSALATGAHYYTLLVRSWTGGSYVETTTPIWILIENESTSPYGAGWTLAGVQHVYDDGGNIAITGGDGSLSLFPLTCDTACAPYTSPWDFTKVTRHNSPGADSTQYERRYPDGTIYKFYGDGRLAFVQGPYGNKTTIFTYDTLNLLVGIGDTVAGYPNGTPTHYLDYYSLSYDTHGHLASISSEVAHGVTAWINSSTGNLDSLKGPTSQFSSGTRAFLGTYDGQHRLRYWKDRRGGEWRIGYDFAGRTKADTAPSINSTVSCTGGGRCPVTQYASLESVELVDPGSGQGTSGNPASPRNATTLRATITNPRGYATAYMLGRYGQATRIEQPLGRTTTFAYDPAGHHTVDTLPSGHVMRYTWDKIGNLTQQFDVTTYRSISYTYDSSYNLLTGINGHVDAVRNWVNTIAHDGHPAYSIFDSSSHAGATEQMRDTVWDLYGPTPQCVQSKPYRIQQCRPQGPQAYDATHQGLVNDSSVITAYQEEGTTGLPDARVSWTYDWSGRPTQTITRVNSAESDTAWTVYDTRGRDSVVIKQLYDTLRDTTRYFYGAVNPNPDSVVDAKGHVYRVWPNALGWADSTKDPTGAFTKFHYDLNGNVDTVTPRRGVNYRVTHQRDALDNDTLVAAGHDTTWFTTDPHDRFKTAKNKLSTDSIRFDSAGRKVAEVTCRAIPTVSCFKDSSEYNIRDLRTKLIVSSVSSLWSPHTVTYYYDGLISRLDSMTNFTNERVVFGYAPTTGRDSTRTFRAFGLIESFAHTPWIEGKAAISFNAGDVNLAFGSAYRYDEAQRLRQHFHGRTALPDTTRFAVLDRGGRLSTYTDKRFTWDSSGAAPCSVRWYGLNPDDPLTRLGETCDYAHKQILGPVIETATYAYDAVGNRVDSLTQTYAATDNANRLLRLKNLRMTYDADGNLLVKRRLKSDTTQVPFETDSLFWSAQGHLDSLHYKIDGVALIRVNYGYDGWGRFVRTDFPDFANSTENYLYDGDERLFHLNSTGARVTYATWYPGTHERQSMAFTNASGVDTTLYFITDALHNVVGRLRSQGGSYVIESKYRYSPYGDSTIAAPAGKFSNVRYKGAITMSAGLYEMGARFYDPAVGRFISEDPAGLAAGINVYAFAGNDPVNGWDPSGMGPCDGPANAIFAFFDLDCGGEGGGGLDLGVMTGPPDGRPSGGFGENPFPFMGLGMALGGCPLAGGCRVTGYFGEYRPKSTPPVHLGTDFHATIGTMVYGSCSGVVTKIRPSETARGGNEVTIQSPNGNFWTYSHLSDILVRAGDWIAQYSPIARSGRSGGVTPHLHQQARTPGGWMTAPMGALCR